MATREKNLPIDHKWHDLTQFGNMAKPHVFSDGEYLDIGVQTQNEYPKVKYHADFVAFPKDGQEYGFTELPQVVHDREEEEAFGPEWKNGPADVGVITAPDVAHAQAQKRARSAAGANWRSTALPNSNPDLTEAHLQFLKSQGAEVKTMAEMYTLLSGMTSQQMKSFMKEAAEWEKAGSSKKKAAS